VSSRIGGSGKLVPDLDEVAIEIAREEIRLPGHELSLFGDRTARMADALGRVVDVLGFDETKTEVRDAGALSHRSCRPLEHNHVVRARRLRLDEVVAAIHGDHAEHRLVEGKRALGICHAERDVAQTVGPNGAVMTHRRYWIEVSLTKRHRCEPPTRVDAIVESPFHRVMIVMVSACFPPKKSGGTLRDVGNSRLSAPNCA